MTSFFYQKEKPFQNSKLFCFVNKYCDRLIVIKIIKSAMLPKNWVGCPKMAIGLVDQLFFTFKTPLSPALNRNLSPDGQFHPENIFDHFTDQFKERPVLWIDLTNTSRYYRKEIVEDKGIKYLKMAMEGHGLPPSVPQRLQFSSACDEFLKENPEGCIAVHCTHGFNRTGFLICNYLISRKEYNVHEALTEFSRQRPPGIYRQNYVDFLYEIYKENMVKEGKEICGDLPPVPKVQEPRWATAGNGNLKTKANPTNNNYRKMPAQSAALDNNWRNRNRSEGIVKRVGHVSASSSYNNNWRSTNEQNDTNGYSARQRYSHSNEDRHPRNKSWTREGYQHQQQQQYDYAPQTSYADYRQRRYGGQGQHSYQNYQNSRTRNQIPNEGDLNWNTLQMAMGFPPPQIPRPTPAYSYKSPSDDFTNDMPPLPTGSYQQPQRHTARQ